MNDGRGPRENLAVRGVLEGDDARGQRLRGQVARVAQKQDGAAAQSLSGQRALAVKVLRDEDGRRPEREDEGRGAVVQKVFQLGRNLRLVLEVEKGEARDDRPRGPVRLTPLTPRAMSGLKRSSLTRPGVCGGTNGS